MRICDDDLEAAAQAYLATALGQDAGFGTEDCTSLRDAGYDASCFLPEAVDAVREDVAALAWAFRDEIEAVSPKTLANLLGSNAPPPTAPLSPALTPT